MNRSQGRSFITAISVPFIIGFTCLASGAVIGVSWNYTQVTAVAIVEPGNGGFVPTGLNASNYRWTKADVTPVVLVKPGIGGFVPREGISIGNQWRKDEVNPVMLVEPLNSTFVPFRAVYKAGSSTAGSRTSLPSTNNVIETRSMGDFTGWDGETIVRLANGQIWQQTEYYYHYLYAYMPKVLIYNSGGSFKMKVDGISRAVRVQCLK